MLANLLCGDPEPGVHLSGRSIDVSESFGREKMIEVFSILKLVLQDVGHEFVNRLKANFGSATQSILVKLIVQLNLVHRPQLLDLTNITAISGGSHVNRWNESISVSASEWAGS